MYVCAKKGTDSNLLTSAFKEIYFLTLKSYYVKICQEYV